MLTPKLSDWDPQPLPRPSCNRRHYCRVDLQSARQGQTWKLLGRLFRIVAEHASRWPSADQSLEMFRDGLFRASTGGRSISYSFVRPSVHIHTLCFPNYSIAFAATFASQDDQSHTRFDFALLLDRHSFKVQLQPTLVFASLLKIILDNHTSP
jgi:hypothetical protein